MNNLQDIFDAITGANTDGWRTMDRAQLVALAIDVGNGSMKPVSDVEAGAIADKVLAEKLQWFEVSIRVPSSLTPGEIEQLVDAQLIAPADPDDAAAGYLPTDYAGTMVFGRLA